DAANYFFRGAPWTGSAYPDPPLPSTASGFSACGLAYRSVVSGASFEPLLAMSGRFNSAGYFFTGWRDSANIYADSGGGLADVTPDPAIANWFQWMVSADPAGNQLLFAWKYYGDAAWNMSVLTAHYGAQTLRRLFLGTDEWGTGVGGKAAMANVRVWFKL